MTTRFADWMSAQGLIDREVADKLGLERSTVTRLRLGTQQPSLETLARIVELTGGAVGLEDFLGEKSRES